MGTPLVMNVVAVVPVEKLPMLLGSRGGARVDSICGGRAIAARHLPLESDGTPRSRNGEPARRHGAVAAIRH